MREILFRGKRVDNGEWVYGFLCKTYSPMNPKTRDAIMHTNLEIDYPEYSCAEINVATVGQYTEVTDKNGKKIFEGDIIKCTYIYDKGCGLRFEPKIEVVVYRQGNFNPLYNCERNSFEVIGNIHDNPELLNGER